MTGRFTLWLLAGQFILLATITLAFLRLSEAKSAFADSLVNERTCEQLAEEILKLRELSSVAEEQQSGSDLANSQLVKLAGDSGITEGQILSIRRLPAMAIEKTDYQRQDLAIELRDVTMPQVLQFALLAERQLPTAKFTSIDLASQSRRQGTTPGSIESWNVQLILTQLIYDARSPDR